MRLWGVVWLFAFAGCYRGPSGLAPCAIRCTEGCPEGTTCAGGYCTSGGATCTLDAPACGGAGEACCDTSPACNGNAYCTQGTCQSGCVTEVALGRRHTCVIEHGGSVWCSGDDDRGQLGVGSAGAGVTSFVRATDAAGPISDATAVCAGRAHSCAVRAGGAVWCWGEGDYGQLGNNIYGDSPVAVEVVVDSGAALAGIDGVVCGRLHTCAHATDGTMYCWGDNSQGQIGDGTAIGRATALQVPGLAGVTSFAGGDYHVCTLDSVAQVRCWGGNASGEIGDGTQNNALAPFALPLANVTAIATGAYHTCALLADTTMQCWGANTRRWLGTGAGKGQIVLVPTPVLAPDGVTPYSGVAAMALGSVSCALRTGGRVDCWSDDIHGQSGNGGTFYPRPVVEGTHELTDVAGITAHYAHVCAHMMGGGIMCWGRGSEGEFGDGTMKNRGEPAPIGASCDATTN